MNAAAGRFRVRWTRPDPAGEQDMQQAGHPAEQGAGRAVQQVEAQAHPVTRTVSLTLPAHQQVTVDVVTARAVLMLLSHAVFGVLRPDGPYLAVEENTTAGWTPLREATR